MIYSITSSIAYFISRNIFKIGLHLFFRLKVEGEENVPRKGAFIAASNHVSYMDPPIVGSAFRRRVYFITSDHLFKSRSVGWWYNIVGCIRIKRGEADHRAIRKILDYLKDGKPVALFPEGTRSEDGELKDPFLGIGFLALKSQVPVVPCFIKGSEVALPRGARSFRKARIRLYMGKMIEAREFACDGAQKKEAYRLLSRKVMNSIAGLKKCHAD